VFSNNAHYNAIVRIMLHIAAQPRDNIMSRKDYRAIARILSDYRPAMNDLYFNNMVEELAGVMQRDNPRFDASRFKQACYCQD